MGNISYEEWVYPGLIMLINTIIIAPIIFLAEERNKIREKKNYCKHYKLDFCPTIGMISKLI